MDSVFDRTADEMREAILSYASSGNHGKVAILAIMAHGDLNGNLRGCDEESVCSVQEVVKSFCVPQLENIPKVKYSLNTLY